MNRPTPVRNDATSRAEAIRRGDKLYFTGKPCRAGHASRRYTSTSMCVACGQDRAGMERGAHDYVNLTEKKRDEIALEKEINYLESLDGEGDE